MGRGNNKRGKKYIHPLLEEAKIYTLEEAGNTGGALQSNIYIRRG
jgi:hypothetical protein